MRIKRGLQFVNLPGGVDVIINADEIEYLKFSYECKKCKTKRKEKLQNVAPFLAKPEKLWSICINCRTSTQEELWNGFKNQLHNIKNQNSVLFQKIVTIFPEVEQYLGK